jgi:serine/threonine protein kinase
VAVRTRPQVLPLSSLADANKLRRVQNEIDINQVLHHPHVVTFLGSFQDDQNVYLLQELCCEYV